MYTTKVFLFYSNIFECFMTSLSYYYYCYHIESIFYNVFHTHAIIYRSNSSNGVNTYIADCSLVLKLPHIQFVVVVVLIALCLYHLLKVQKYLYKNTYATLYSVVDRN